MSAFHYIAIDKQGREQKGVIEAEGLKHARQLLRDRALIPTQVKLAEHHGRSSDASYWLRNIFKRRNVNAKSLALITRQWATLLSAGLPLEETLGAAAEQAEASQIKSLILSVRSKVLEGHSFAAALSDHPDDFSKLYCATIAAGEKSGHLDKVLLRLADYTEQQAHLKQKLSTALIYPAMIVLVALSIVGFLLEYVVPKMVSVYGSLNQTLPWMTTFLISLSEGITSYGLYGLIIIALGFYGFKHILRRSPLFRERFHRLILRLPLFGYAFKTADTARFSRTLSILSASGVSVLDAMTIASQLITMIPIRKAVDVAVSAVREGKTIHSALKQTTYFTPMSVHMIASGEVSGQLENMLERVAKMQEDDLLRLVEVALALFEPGIILIMGAVILFIVLAVLLPIFQLNQMAG